MDRYGIKTRQLSIDFIKNDCKKKPEDFDKLFFDMGSQREEGQWSSEWKSDLIHSLLQGYYIPEIHIVATGTKNIKPMSVFEGKQRITSARENQMNFLKLFFKV